MSAINASTILGVDAVKKTMNSMSPASALLLYRAAARARAEETTSASASAAMPSQRVLRNLDHTRELTGTRKYIDSPISPTTAPRSHLQYLTGIGWSRP